MKAEFKADMDQLLETVAATNREIESFISKYAPEVKVELTAASSSVLFPHIRLSVLLDLLVSK